MFTTDLLALAIFSPGLLPMKYLQLTANDDFYAWQYILQLSIE